MQSTVRSLSIVTAISCPARQQVVLVERVDVLEMILSLRAGNEFHAAAFEIGRRQRHPGGDDVVLAQSPIERVLMPGHEAWAFGFLDEEVRRPAQQVRTEDRFDGIENLRVVHQFVDPGEQQMRLVAEIALQRFAGIRLMRFERAAEIGDLVRRQHRTARI